MCIEDGILVGIRRAESMADGSHIVLNPEADAVHTAASLTSYSDQTAVCDGRSFKRVIRSSWLLRMTTHTVLVRQIHLSFGLGQVHAGPHKIVSVPPAEDLMQDEVLLPEKTLFIGWRRDLQDMLMELD